MAKFTKNKRGYYQTGIVLGHDENGRVVRKWIYAKTISELERKILEIKGEILSGKNLLHNDVSFEEYSRLWFETYKANRGVNTQAMYKNLLRCHFESINYMKIRDIRPMHLQALINEHSSMPRTCEQLRMCLRQIFKQAIADDIITKNPAALLDLPRHVKKEKRALTAAEKAALKAADLTEKERAFIMLAYGCGLRPGEIYALTWNDFDFKNNIVRIDKSLVFVNNNKPQLTFPKTNKSIRSVEVPQAVMRAVKEYRSTNICPRLFAGRDGEYMGLTGYAGIWKRIKRKIEKVLGYETDLSLYCFRHNYVTALYYSLISLKEAQRLVGHSSYKMIMDVYAHLDAEKEDTAAKLNAIEF